MSFFSCCYRSARTKRLKKKFFSRSDIISTVTGTDLLSAPIVFFHPHRRRLSAFFDLVGSDRSSLVVPPRPYKVRSPSHRFFSFSGHSDNNKPWVFVSTSLALPVDIFSFFSSFDTETRRYSLSLFYIFSNFCFSGKNFFFFLKFYQFNTFFRFIIFSFFCFFFRIFLCKEKFFFFCSLVFPRFVLSSSVQQVGRLWKIFSDSLTMPTFQQLLKGARVPKFKKCRTKGLYGAPQRKAVCVRVYTTTPKKPNSAIRKVAKVRLLLNGRKLLAYIPGFGHNLSQHSTVLLRGGRVRDVPGMHYKLMRGKFDFLYKEKLPRSVRRSKYGYPHPKKSKLDFNNSKKK